MDEHFELAISLADRPLAIWLWESSLSHFRPHSIHKNLTICMFLNAKHLPSVGLFHMGLLHLLVIAWLTFFFFLFLPFTSLAYFFIYIFNESVPKISHSPLLPTLAVALIIPLAFLSPLTLCYILVYLFIVCLPSIGLNYMRASCHMCKNIVATLYMFAE